MNLKEYNFILEKKYIAPYHFVKEHTILPIDEINSKVIIAISNDSNYEAINEMRLILNKEIETKLFLKEEIEEAIEFCYRKKTKVEINNTEILKNNSKDNFDGYDLLENEENEAIKFLNSTILDAISQKASDIHFEPFDDNLLIRFRIDGILQKRSSTLSSYSNQIITRLKVMSKLDIAETRLPQDGRIKLLINKREIDFRLSTIPTTFGERIVLRILDKKNIILGLENLSIKEKVYKLIKEMISFSEGIILVTGPTGSGKTTTLYSAISDLNSSTLNIMTIEDPVEFKLNNIAQISINPKINLTFSKGLRHILRQDPDVIMIGEIRDSETAQIAIQSSLTGHLVLSTLHTNDAPSAIVRLSDMNIESYLISSSIIGIIAQRLVRKLCSHCKKSYSPTKEELKILNMDVEILYKPKGCEHCFQTGYLGRTGIYEIMKMNPKIKKQILKNLDSEAIKETLDKDFIDLKSYGLDLAKDGITSIGEVLRICKNS
ncbi:MAG: Type II secretion system protein E [Candidatus Anoxychlamydiales bacterium]|nr:Type II secretion system protein E [Candidatus Anoxychlamydiales bacterium]